MKDKVDFGNMGDIGEGLFFQEENKQILWDLMENSHYFDGLGKNDFKRTLSLFEETMLEVWRGNRMQDLVGLNKIFLLKMRDRIDRVPNTSSVSNASLMSRNSLGSSVSLKSNYTLEIEREMKDKKSEMLGMLNPKVPEVIDFTLQKPYNADVRDCVSFNSNSVDEFSIDSALEDKIRAREKELSNYYESGQGLDLKLKGKVENKVDFVKQESLVLHAYSVDEVENKVDDKRVSFENDLKISNGKKDDSSLGVVDISGLGLESGLSLSSFLEFREEVLNNLRVIIEGQKRTNMLIESEIEVMLQLVNKID